MIYVDRSRIVEPKTLSKKGGRGRKETAKAIVFYRNPANKLHSFPYSAYRGKKVKKALKDLFYKKCAYCESKIAVVSHGEIEHFRPKGGTGKNPKKLNKPGYYWLASDWNNLLLACQLCNQYHTSEIVGKGTITQGKANQFPLKREKFRLKSPMDKPTKEEPYRLLLNPCIDRPERYIWINDQGLIKPKKRGRGYSQKAIKSIDIYSLQRKDLVEEREGLIIEIKAQLTTVKTILKIQEDIGIGSNPDIDGMVTHEITKLKRYLNPKKPHLSIAKSLIEPFMKKMGLS